MNDQDNNSETNLGLQPVFGFSHSGRVLQPGLLRPLRSGESVYKAQSPQAEPVRPSWKNLSIAEHLRALYVRIINHHSHQLSSSESAQTQIRKTSQNNLRVNQSYSNIFKISAQQHSDDGHHGQTSVSELCLKFSGPAAKKLKTNKYQTPCGN